VFKKETSYKFINAANSSNLYTSPGANGKLVDIVNWESNFYSNVRLMKTWLGNLKLNLDIGDPWAELADHNDKKIHIGDDKQESFSEEDIDFVDKKLDIILEALQEFATDFNRIKDDLNYLKSSGKNVSKKDWGLMMMGNVMGWAMSSAIPKEAIGEVWTIIVQNLENQNLIN
jgi:hypothetical protein